MFTYSFRNENKINLLTNDKNNVINNYKRFKMSKLQRQMLIWIIGLFLLSIAVKYFGQIAMWGLSILFVWSLLDAKFAAKLENKYEKVKDELDKFEDTLK